MTKTLLTIFVTLGTIILLTAVDAAAQNTPPTIRRIVDSSYVGDSIISAVTITEGDSLTWSFLATDPDPTDFLSMSIDPPDNDPGYHSRLTFIDNGGGDAFFQFLPDYEYAQDTTFVITFIADDGTDADSASVTINVVHFDPIPVLDSIGPQSVTEGQTLVVSITASDADGWSPSISAINAPANASMITGTLFEFTPDFTQGGQSYDILFIATDLGGQADSETVTIDVIDAGNQIPVFDSIAPQTISEFAQLDFSITVIDPEKDSLVIQSTNLPANSSLIPTGVGTADFSFNPDGTQAGSYDIIFTSIDDSAAVGSLTVAITVSANDFAPVIITQPDTLMNEGDTLTLRMRATDADGFIPIFSYDSIPPFATFVDSGNGSASFRFTPNFLQSGTYQIQLFASDGYHADTSGFQLTIAEAGNREPIFDPVSDTTILEGDSLSFTVVAVDPDGETPVLSMDSPVGNSGFTDNEDGSGDFYFYPNLSQGGAYDFVFFATDSSMAIAMLTVRVTVSEVDFPPTFNPISNASATEGRLFELELIAVDSESVPLVWMSPPADDSIFRGAADFVTNPDGTAIFSFNADYDFLQIDFETIGLDMVFYATDGIDTAAASFTLSLSDVPRHDNDTGLADTMYITTGYWDGEDTLLFKCHVYNDNIITAASTGFSWTDPYLICDRIEIGSRFDTANFITTEILNDSLMFYVGFQFNSARYIDSGFGKYFTAYFHYDSAGVWDNKSIINFDTTKVGSSGDFLFDRQLKGKSGLNQPGDLRSSLTLSPYTYTPLIYLDRTQAAFDSVSLEVYDLTGDSLLKPGDTIYAGINQFGNDYQYDIRIGIENPDSLGSISLGIITESPDSASWNWFDYGNGLGPVSEIPGSRMADANVWLGSGGLAINLIDIGDTDSLLVTAQAGANPGAGLPPGRMENMISVRFTPVGPISGIDSICIDTATIGGTGVWSATNLNGDSLSPGTNGRICFPIFYRNLVDVSDNPQLLPQSYQLSQNYPNPFNPSTTIRFNLPKAEFVSLRVFNILGQLVVTLADRPFSAGANQITWDGKDGRGRRVASGIYLYRIDTKSFTDTRKMILMK